MKRIVLCAFVAICCLSGIKAENKKELKLMSDRLTLTWVQETDGWHVREIKVNGKELPNLRGYYTLLHLERKPAPSLVFQDLEGKQFTFYPEKAEQLADGSVRFTHSLRFGTMEAVWRLDPDFPEDIKVTIRVEAKQRGYLSIATPTLVTFDKDKLAWGMVPGNYYGTELQSNINLAKEYSMGIPVVPVLAVEKGTETLCPLLSSKDNITMAVIPEPGTAHNPYEKDKHDRSVTKLAMGVMNRHNELTPCAYSPVLGESPRLEAGETASFSFRYAIRATGWFPVFKHAVEDIYKLPGLLDIQHNKVSLSERVGRMQKYLRDDKRSSWSTWQSRGYTIGANGSKIADAGVMYMIARNGNDEPMKNRLPYVRNYKMCQQQTEPGFFQGAALGEYADEDGVESERGNWIEPLQTTYYTMVDFGNMLLFDPSDKELLDHLRMAADKLLDWQHADGGFDVAYDRFSCKLAFPDLEDYRPTWYGFLIAYKILGDDKYLRAAQKGAMWQYENGVKKGYYLGVCGDARNIWDFCTAQTAQSYIDLYELTKNELYKEAAIDAARVYTTSIWTHPIATEETKYVRGIPYKDWEVNQTGLGVEHIRGTGTSGPISLSSYAGMFTRIYAYTGDELFLTMARVAARGRHLVVPEDSGCAMYYWFSGLMNENKRTVFPWHAYWQIGWITDYLMGEASVRSEGKIKFPYGFMTPKVGPSVTYGFAPGKIYEREADLLLRPDMVKTDNQDVEYITALSPDKRKLYLVLLSQSPFSQSCTVSLDLKQLDGKTQRFKSVKSIQGKIKKEDKSQSTLSFDFAPWGMTVVELIL
ncbi:MAG: hypothetical protein AB2L24_20090 [Mangrovibacterium sp.]